MKTRGQRLRRCSDYFTDPSFPLAIRTINQQDSLGFHQHEFHELVIIQSGKGIHRMDEEAYHVVEGDVFIITPDMVHSYENVSGLSLVNILYVPERLNLSSYDINDLPGYHVLFMVEPVYRRRDQFRNRLHINLEELSHALGLVKQMEHEMSDLQCGYKYTTVALFMQLICYLSRCYSSVDTPGIRAMMKIGKLLSYIEQHYHRTLTLDDLTSIAHMSMSTLQRTFKTILGYSPMDYVIRLRISKAKEYLRDSDLNIGEIAVRTGFNDSNYFSRKFSDIAGFSPREYRTRYTQG
jgi:AraC-like DNA-binding protein/quercetin dioxygenase-like cupin family protein